MISFSELMRKVLTERMSFRDLLAGSDPGRKKRAKSDVRARSIRVKVIDGNEAWAFTYKSNPSTTGKRWHGFIKFFESDVSSKENAEDLDCQVDCDCLDFRYKWAYADAKQDASSIGGNSLNQCINKPPNKTNPNQVPGMCKHLISLGKFLETSIEAPDPDNPDDVKPEPKVTKPVQRVTPKTPQTTDAPSPDDPYTDSRENGYSDSRSELQENVSNLYKRMEKFVRGNPEFDVMIEE